MRRPSPSPFRNEGVTRMIAQTTNPQRFSPWRSEDSKAPASPLPYGRVREGLLSIAFWGFLLLAGSVLFVFAFLGLFFDVQF